MTNEKEMPSPGEENENFIDYVVNSLYLKDSEINQDVAFASAHALIGSVTGNKIFVLTMKGKLSADIQSFTFGDSGSSKTMTLNVVREALIKLDIEIPSDFTKEGLIHWFSEKEKGDDGFETDKYKHKNYGSIIWDEASSIFSENKNKKYKTGVIELLSEIYDHYLKGILRKDHSLSDLKPQRPFISLFATMVTQYFPSIPEIFFVQGIAGRIHFVHVPPKEPKSLEDEPDWNEYSNLNTFHSKEKVIQDKLKQLRKNLSPYKPIIIKIDGKANELIKKFSHICKTRWFTSAKYNPYGWDWQYYNRLPEMACKAALRYAIGRKIENIKKLKYITDYDMKRGIDFAKQSSIALQKLFTKRIGKTSKLNSPIARVRYALRNAHNQMLNSHQWKKASGISSPNHFQELRDEVIKEGFVVEVNKKTITDEKEQQRLGIKTRAKVFRWVKD